jgi:CubicO group peptidase (beta-lactamase class C family)
MFKSRLQIVLALFAVAVGALITFVVGLNVYVRATATPIHPDAQSVPSLWDAGPASAWKGAVDQARQIARAEVTGQNLPGLSIAVGVDGDVVWSEAFGWADLENKIPAAPNLRFRIGTASKVLTSAAVGQLIERGRLSLDDEIRMHVPDFTEKEWPVTLRQVMGHTAGVRNDGGDESPLYGHHCERPIEALSFFADRSLLFEPGTRYRYSNYGWILVSAAVEAAANEPFFTVMQKQVFEPLGMHDTRAESANEAVADRVTSYFPRFGADTRLGYHVMRELDLSCYAGASAFLSTPSDLVRFGMAVNRGTLLKPETVQVLQTPQRLSSGEETGYGLGWDLEPVTLHGAPLTAVGHDGEVLGGTVGSLMTIRERGIVVAVLSNISYADTFAIASKVAEVFATERKSPPPQ